MNIIKHEEFFNPDKMDSSIHIIGLGAIGSTVAEMLARLGCTNLHLYDFDTVSDHNIANQMFRFKDIGQLKCNAVQVMLSEINPSIDTSIHPDGYRIDQPHRPLTGYVFLCVDDIELRRAIVEENLDNPHIKMMADFRMRLTDAQHYAADWSKESNRIKLLKTMQFTNDQADKATPVSACGTSLSVVPTVRTIVSLGVANFINFANGKPLSTLILSDPFNKTLDNF